MRDRVGIKMQAKDIMRGARTSPYLVTLILLAITFVLNKIVEMVEFGSLFYSYAFTQQYLDLIASGDLNALDALIAAMPENTTGVFFLSTLVSLFTIVLNGGYFIYCMGIRQGLRMPCASLADGLSVAGKLIWCWIQVSVRTFLWSLLLVIPGIVAAYRYRFAYYNLLTDASLSAGDAIRLSCQQTQGFKLELLILDLSFTGWALLASLTMGLLNIWLTPYMTLCDLGYFEEAQLRLGRNPYGTPPPPAGGDPWL
ncbi:MAG: DUF975 family protein [Oscillospiraceae bacterium]|jgi:uncharacterized membrane protein|nr:DUF975 family protein [Oscillospiraceae bacterium]